MKFHINDDGQITTRDGRIVRVSTGEVSQAYGLTSTGTNQNTALEVSGDVNVITTCASNTGVRLPVPQGGGMIRILIINKGANALSVYPHVGGYIDANAINVASSLAVDTPVDLVSVNGSRWYSV